MLYVPGIDLMLRVTVEPAWTLPIALLIATELDWAATKAASAEAQRMMDLANIASDVVCYKDGLWGYRGSVYLGVKRTGG